MDPSSGLAGLVDAQLQWLFLKGFLFLGCCYFMIWNVIGIRIILKKQPPKAKKR